MTHDGVLLRQLAWRLETRYEGNGTSNEFVPTCVVGLSFARANCTAPSGPLDRIYVTYSFRVSVLGLKAI